MGLDSGVENLEIEITKKTDETVTDPKTQLGNSRTKETTRSDDLPKAAKLGNDGER